MRVLARALPFVVVVTALAQVLGSGGSDFSLSADVPAVPISRPTPTELMALGDSITSGADAAQAGTGLIYGSS